MVVTMTSLAARSDFYSHKYYRLLTEILRDSREPIEGDGGYANMVSVVSGASDQGVKGV